MTDYMMFLLKEYVANYTGLPKACWQGISLTFINAVAAGICFFLSLYFVDSLHINIATAGILISSYGLGTVIGGVAGGKLSDKISPKVISIGSLLVQSMAFLLLAKLKSIEMLMINLFILGVAAYGFKTSNNVWTFSQCNAQSRFKTISLSHVASNLGLGLSGVIIGMGYSFQYILLLSALLLSFSAIYLMFLQTGSELQASISDELDTGNQVNLNSIDVNKKIIMMILMSVFLVGLIISQLSATYPIYVQNAFPQWGIKAVSILFILDTVLIILFQAPLSEAVSGYNKILIAGIGAFLMGLGMLILSFSFVFLLAIISCIIWTTGEMLFISTAQLICYEKCGERKKGQSMGVFQATFAASSVIGPTIGGVVYQYAGGNMLWYLSAFIGVFCLGGCLYYRQYD